ncbi:MAG: division/cell wall cluster transcriptional repressor MraZ [Ruminiclostridium sp.]|nr:division/cell wall cluster transcriptional repressor MraZ [Ruminiclostridium sp.]
MFGAHKSTLDAKGRMNIPIKLREELGETFFLAKNIGTRCIRVYSEAEWDALMKSLDELPPVKTQTIRRYLVGSADKLVADKQGRVSVNSELIAYAGLTTDVMVIGMGKSGMAEIWDKAAWTEFNESLDTEEEVRRIAEELGM